VRQRADGQLDFAGRADDQVKVRGFRIELGEIEAALQSHPHVLEAVALVDGTEDPVLVAHVTTTTAAPSTEALMAHLRAMLPAYAVPSHLERHAQLPRTSGGKPDRAALRAAVAHPLSFAQEQQWFLQTLEPRSATYNLHATQRWQGPLDRDALDAALTALQTRHESLRTRYVAHDGQPQQVIDPPSVVRAEHLDAAANSSEKAVDTARQLLYDRMQTPFDIAAAPQFDPIVVRLGPDDHLVSLRVHHIAVDGWSLDQLSADLAELYAARVDDREPDLPDVEWQPRHIAARDRQLERSGELDAVLDRWAHRLHPIPTPLALRLDRPRPAERTTTGVRCDFAIDPADAARLLQLARETRSSPFAVGLALFVVHLARLGRSLDITVGTPIADRLSAPAQHTVGMLVTTLPVRVQLHPGASLRQLVELVRDATRATVSDMAAPLDRIVRRVGPPRVAGLHPLFQTMFQLDVNGSSNEVVSRGSVEVTPFRIGTSGAHFDLCASLKIDGDDASGYLMFADDIFDRSTMQVITTEFSRLVSQALGDVDASIVSDSAEPSSPAVTTATAALSRVAPVASDDDATRKLMGLFASVLGVEVRADTDFFSAGGHSLLAVRLFSQLERDLGVRAPLGAIFEAPTPRLLAVRLGLTADEPSPLDHALTNHALTNDARTAPVSYAQERMWVAAQMRAGGNSYVENFSRRITGPLDLEAFTRAIDAVVARHESLRTRFLATDDALVQVIDPPTRAAVEIRDRTHVALSDRDADIQATLPEIMLGVQDLERGPLFEAFVLRYADDDHAWLVRMHHLVIDATSLDHIVRDVIASYEAQLSGQGPALPELSLQYRDFAVRQRDAVARGDLDDDLSWWEQTLAHAPTELNLPYDHPRGSRTSAGAGGLLVAPLSDALDEQLRELAKSVGSTRHRAGMAFMGAFLYRLTGQSDIVLGMASAERLDDDLLPLVGLFVNTLPVRTRVDATSTMRALVRHVHDSTQAAIDHRRAPLDRVLERLRRTRGIGALVHTSFDYRHLYSTQSIAMGPTHLSEIRRPRDIVSGAKFDIDATIRRTSVGLFLEFRYDRDRFDEATARAMLDSFHGLLLAGLADPDRAIAELPAPAVVRPTLEPPPAASPSLTSTAVLAHPTPQLPVSAGLHRLCEAFAAVLDTQIGPDDDFFASGGHSLLAVRLFSRLERTLGVRLPLAALFDAPTPRLLAGVLGLDASTTGIESASVCPSPEPAPRSITSAAYDTPVRLHLDRAPLSFSQRRMWITEQFDSTGTTHVLPMAFDLFGPLDEVALQCAVNALVARHEILRTVYRADDDGIPFQRIAPPAAVIIDRIHPSGPASHTASVDAAPIDEAAVNALLRARVDRPFDLSTEPSLRVVLARLADHHHVLALVVHHIATDAGSEAVMLDDFASVYTALAEARSPDSEELTHGTATLPIQYSDFAVWQQARAARGELDAAIEHWTTTLASPPDALRLPTVRVRPAQVSGGGDYVHRRAGSSRRARLDQFARAQRTTPFIVLLSAYELLLQRMSGQRDLVVGIPSTERTFAQAERSMGYFVNTLPIRVQIDATHRLADVLGATRSAVATALTHADAPFDLVIERLSVARDLSTTPIFQAMFSLDDAERGEGVELPGLRVRRRSLGMTTTAKCDLSLFATFDEDLSLAFEYRSDVFDASQVDAWSQAYLRILDALLSDTEQLAAAVELTDAATQRWLRTETNRTHRPYPSDATIGALFDDIAFTHVNAVAIVDGDRTVTYGELATSVDQFGQALSTAGVGAGDRVVCELPRGLDLIVAIVAIVRIGAAYVPIDPTYPAARRDRMRSAARARAAVVRGTDSDPEHGIRIVALESDADPLDTGGGAVGTGAQRAAYVMFTSGSTGEPKGVVVPHRGIVRLVRNSDHVSFGPDTVMAHLSNTSFDAATFELWGALLNGGTLVVLDADTVTSPVALGAAIRAHGITTMFVTTALFNVVSHEHPEAFAPLHDLVFGGEAGDPDAVRALLAAGGPRRLVNGYGPTESTTFAAWHRIEHLDPRATTVPIGRPLANTTLYVVDDTGRLVPPQVEGELLIGGDGLALGYLDDPVLTAARFVPDCFGDAPGGRLYRTGDIVRRRDDGVLEFVGRADGQVKIRGFRIELGEIDVALTALPGVETAHARVWLRRNGDAQVLGYVTAEAPDAPLDPAALRALLAEQLPAYLVPSVLLVVDELPRNANGKIDNDALPTPVDTADENAAVTAPIPADAFHQRIALVWGGVLGDAPISLNDHFFDRGGTSISAVRLFAAIQREFGVRLSLSTLFSAPTLGALAEAVAHQDSFPVATPSGVGRRAITTTATAGRPALTTPPGSLLVPIRAHGSKPPLFCVHPAGGELFAYAPLVRHLPDDQPVIGIREEGLDGMVPRLPSVEAMADRYVIEVRHAQPHGPYRLAGYSLGGLVAYEMARRLRDLDETVEVLALLDAIPTHPTRGLPTDPVRPTSPRPTGAPLSARGKLSRMVHRARRDGLGEIALRTVQNRVALHVSEPITAWVDTARVYVAARRGLPVDAIVAGRHSERHGVVALARYRAAAYDGNVVLLRAIGTDPDFPVPDERHHWYGAVRGTLDVIDVPGDHAGTRAIVDEPFVATLGAALSQVLARAGREPSA
jgi:amino acid adenylation domain-containing protein